MVEIRALIADDEPLARRGIRQLLAAHQDIEVVAECRNGRETLWALQTLKPDLLFLDVQMPEVDGFGVLRAHGPAGLPATIFVTAYDEFAVRAFDAHALDYLVKPVTEARFATALARARERMHSAEAVELTKQFGALLALYDSDRSKLAAALERDTDAKIVRRISVPTHAGTLLLDTSEIDWIQAEDYYAAIHARGRRLLIRESLVTLETRLDPQQFVRVHRSAIVSVDRIRELRSARRESIVVLRDGTRIPVSRRRREQVAAVVRGVGR